MHFISSAMASFCLETTVEDAMQTVRDAGFDSLDFPLSVYSRPQDAPLRGDDWRQWARGVRRTADRDRAAHHAGTRLLGAGHSGRPALRITL